MKCARCLAEIPAQSQFCLRCGAPLHATSINPSGGLPAGLGGQSGGVNQRLVAVLVAMFVFLSAIGIGAFVIGRQSSRLPQSPAIDAPSTPIVEAPAPEAAPPAMVQAPAPESPPPAMVQAPATPAAPPAMVQAPTKAAAGPPDDVVEYLEFVKQIEQKKQRLHAEQVAQLEQYATSSIAGAFAGAGASLSPDQQDRTNKDKYLKDSTSTVQDMDGPWNQLAAEFQQHKAPDACADIFKSYYDHLGKVQAAISRASDFMKNLAPSDDQGRLNSEKGDITSSLTRLGQEADLSAQQADDAIAAVCSKYGIKKDFMVRTDTGGSSSLLR